MCSNGRVLALELLQARRLSIASALREVYPIVELEPGAVYSIRGAKLPLSRLMTGYEEEEVSTALGYASHVLALLSKYLQVPLRYFPELVGSRTRIRDDVVMPSGTSSQQQQAVAGLEYPLYWKGVEQRQFATGQKLLALDVVQVRAVSSLPASTAATGCSMLLRRRLPVIF